MMKRFLFFFLLIFLWAYSSSAVSMGGHGNLQSNYIFEPNLEITGSLYIAGEANPVGLKIEIFGPQNLDEYVHLDPLSLVGRGYVNFNISLPDKIDGGIYTIWVCAVEITEGKSYSGEVCHKLSLLATFSGKHLKIEGFTASDTDVNSETINLSFTVSNWGRETVEAISGVFDVYNIKNKSAAQVITTAAMSLASTETKTGIVPLSIKGLGPGEYVVRGKIDWDEGSEKVEDDFKLGSAAFKILNITEKFTAREINDLFVVIKNDFGGVKSPVTLTIEVAGQSVTPPIFGMEAFETKIIKTFLDARGLEPGFYNAKVMVSVPEAATEDTFRFEFAEKPMAKWPFYTAGAIIVIFIILLLIFFRFKRKHEEKTAQP